LADASPITSVLSGTQFSALRIGRGDNVACIVGWDEPSGGRNAMLVAEHRWKGRLVACQLPFGPIDRDPRGQLFLIGALQYIHAPVDIAERNIRTTTVSIEVPKEKSP